MEKLNITTTKDNEKVYKILVGRDGKTPAVPDEKRDVSVGKTAGIGKPAQAAGTTA